MSSPAAAHPRPYAGLSWPQLDRSAGVLLGQACGDALGVPYELAPRLAPDERPEMRGGGLGPYAPGQWSDDTEMAACIAEVASTGADLTDDDALDGIASRFLDWFDHAKDIGNQTRQVLLAARAGDGPAGRRVREASESLHARTGHTAGNGALMRTGVVGLTALHDPEDVAAAARAVARLTHADPLAADSCVLWSVGVAVAVREGTFDGVRRALDLVPTERRGRWRAWLDEAEGADPARFTPNGFTVTALQAAYAAITSTPVPPDDPRTGSFGCLHLQHALDATVRVGDDTDTVAAIAGALLGARWGASAVPARWRRVVHGWPGLRARDLVRLGVLTAQRGAAGERWPASARVSHREGDRGTVAHPGDPGVLLGGAVPAEAPVDAVVTVQSLGVAEAPALKVSAEDHVQVWLVDSAEPADNPNLAFCVDDAARAVAALRAEGRRVLLHGVNAEVATAAVAARYGAVRGRLTAQAKQEVADALGVRLPNPALWSVVDDLG